MNGAPHHHPPSTTLVGRDRELAILRAHLDAALAGHGSLVLIGGEAGIGKTALAEALLAEAADRGAQVLVGRCYDLSETPPYGPWAEAAARVPHATDAPPRPDLAGGEAAASQAALFAQARDWLVALAVTRPPVVLLDDLHWADPASLDLLRFLGRHVGDAAILVLATYRDDALTRRHPLYQLLPTLERESRAVRLDLRRLDLPALCALAGGYALSQADAARLVTYLSARAEGNAFFTAQLLRALEDEDILRRHDGGWALGDLATAGLPTPLRQVLDARLDHLGEGARHLLTLAAILGQAVPLRLWAAVADTAEDDLLDTIERATEARLLEMPSAGDAVRFVHALVREALYEGALPMRRRAWHRRAAEALAATAAPDPDTVAYHLQQAGDDRSGAWLVRAGERAQAAYAWVTAAARYEAALAHLERQGGEPGERGWLLLRLARMRRYDAPEEAITHLEEAIRLGAAAGDRVLAGHGGFNLGLLRCLTGDCREGLAGMAEGVAALGALAPADRARHLTLSGTVGMAPDEHDFRGTLALWLAYCGRFAEAEAEAGRYAIGAVAPGIAGGHGGSSYADAHYALGVIHAALGQPDEAQSEYAHAHDAYLAAGHHYNAALCVVQLLDFVTLAYQADRPGERRRWQAQAERAWARAGGTHAAFAQAEVHVPLMLLEGRWHEARRALEAQLSTQQATAVMRLGPLARAQGDADVAWATVRGWLPEGPGSEPGGIFFHPSLVLQRVAAALALDVGDLPAARAWLAAHDRWLAWSGAVLGRVEGQLGWSTYHRAAGDMASARVHAETALAWAAEPRQPLALLASHRLLGELDTDAGNFATAAIHLEAALTLAAVCIAPYERALTLLALAELHAAIGHRDTAAERLADARAILVPLGARLALARAMSLAATPGVPNLPPSSPTDLLSPREREVLSLLAAGDSTGDMARALFLSPATVQRHIANIYAKIGVHNRAEATAYALRHRLV